MILKYSLRAIYSKITPAKIRKWADAGCAAAVAWGSSNIVLNNPKLGVFIFCVGFIGRFLSEGIYSEEEKDV